MKLFQVPISLAFILILIVSLNWSTSALRSKILKSENSETERVAFVPLKSYITLHKFYWKSIFLHASCNMAKYICGFMDPPNPPPPPMPTPPSIASIVPVASTSTTLAPDPGQTLLQTTYIVVEEKMNWMEAHINCKLQGYELTTVEDSSEFIQLQGVITNSNLTMADFVWTAGNDLLRDGRYTWISTGQSFKDFFPAGNVEPTQLPTEDCVFLYFTPTFAQFVMADYACDFKAASICKEIL